MTVCPNRDLSGLQCWILTITRLPVHVLHNIPIQVTIISLQVTQHVSSLAQELRIIIILGFLSSLLFRDSYVNILGPCVTTPQGHNYEEMYLIKHGE